MGGMDPAQMEGYLTYYYDTFLYITGIEHVESKSIQGASIIKLQFYPGPTCQAMSERWRTVNRARAFMPRAPCLRLSCRFDAGSVPVGNWCSQAISRSVAECRTPP